MKMKDNAEEDSVMDQPSYVYRARITKVYDGDTITADVDVGLGVWVHGQKLRLYGINTPEVRGEEREEGLKARDFVLLKVPIGSEVVVRTYKDTKGKYGRWLADVFYPTPHNPLGPMVSLNETLVARGFAKRMLY